MSINKIYLEKFGYNINCLLYLEHYIKLIQDKFYINYDIFDYLLNNQIGKKGNRTKTLSGRFRFYYLYKFFPTYGLAYLNKRSNYLYFFNDNNNLFELLCAHRPLLY